MPLLCLLAAALLTAQQGCRRDPKGKVPSVPVTIAFPVNVAPALVLIAIDHRLMLHRGATIVPVPLESGKEALNRMLAGQADVAVVAETPLARAMLEDRKFKILATIAHSDRDVCIVARKDRGILAPGDLAHKVIGHTRGTSGHFFLDTFLLAQHLRPGEVQLVDLPPSRLRSALLEGRIDAAASWEPHIGWLAAALGDRALVLRDEIIYTQIFSVVARPDFIEAHPEQVKAILEGLVAAKRLLVEAPEEARAAVARGVQADPDLVSKAMANHDFDLRLDQSLLLSLEDECHWLLDSGEVPGRALPDPLDYLHLAGMQEVRPRGLQVIRSGAGGRR